MSDPSDSNSFDRFMVVRGNLNTFKESGAETAYAMLMAKDSFGEFVVSNDSHFLSCEPIVWPN
jgi:uncharacterized linocin/CFP29 family protein